MSIQKREGETKQGPMDASRHREKQREAIKKGMRDIVADESIITRRKDEKIKIPIKGIKSYRFQHGSPSGQGAGAGHGEGDPGDVIGREPKEGDSGKAGNKPGEDYIESEIEISELVRYMLEEMGLPNLAVKDVAKMMTPEGWQFKNISKTGLRPNIDKKRTMQEGMRRLIHFIEELKRETGRTDQECETALEICHGDLGEALELLLDPQFSLEEHRDASAIIMQDDLRFRSMEEDWETHSNAVILAMMDVSGSMGVHKKYVARSFFFWLTEILRHLYSNVEIRFIVHTTHAKLVDEHHFFHKGESGGTKCHSAFDLAYELVSSQYPASKYNVYPFLFSDGDDWSPSETVQSIRRLLDLDINMIGYGEIVENKSMSELMKYAESAFGLKPVTSDEDSDATVFEGPYVKFLSVALQNEKQILPAIKEFLKKERW